MKQYQVSIRYARALLILADQNKELDSVETDFAHVISLLDQHHEIAHLVSNSTISIVEKEDFVDKVFPLPLTRLLVNFIKVLIRKKRFTLIRDIYAEYHRLYEKKKGIQEVAVVTAISLTRKTEDKLKAVLSKRLRADIRLCPEVDPRILGGMIIRFDGTEINSSFKDRLSELRQKLMK